MGNYPPAYMYRKISRVSSFVSSMIRRSPTVVTEGKEMVEIQAVEEVSGDTRAPTPPSIGGVAQSHNPQEVQEIIEEVKEVVEEVKEVVEEVKEVVEDVKEVVEDVKEVVEEVKEVVEDVIQTVEDIKEVVEEVIQTVEKVQEVVEEVQEVVEEVQEVVEEEQKEAPQVAEVPRVEVPQESPTIVLESFMPPAFHFPTSPFSMSASQPNRLRHRKRRG
jgi:predicted transcriptional regulator